VPSRAPSLSSVRFRTPLSAQKNHAGNVGTGVFEDRYSLGKGKDDVEVSGNIIFLNQFRSRRSPLSAIELMPVTSPDTNTLSRRLCLELAMTNARGSVPLESIARRTRMPTEDAVVAAAYAHSWLGSLRRWVRRVDVQWPRCGRRRLR
jgi:hypothetical protein